MKKLFLKKQFGFSLIEIVIASSILLTTIVFIFSAFTLSLATSVKNTAHVQAAFLLEEGNEALRNMRDWGFGEHINSLANGTSYRLAFENRHWQATTTNIFIDEKFDRTFTLAEVRRDADHNVVTSGGSIDMGTRKVIVSVSWLDGVATTTKIMESYVSDIFSN